ncbi:MAG: hypothetical protein IKT32_00490, partial [Clostridia bacterium]|nr:hypothetical protein [Clostridia bacterium]
MREKAIDQWTRELPVKAQRGDITDRNGVILAGSKGSYAVFVRPRCVTNLSEVCTVLSKIFDKSYDELYKKISSSATSELLIKSQVDKNKINELEGYELAGVYYSVDNTRVYPFDSALCQTIGYLSVDGNGQSGLEKYYNEYLKGKDGEILYESDLTGKDLSKTPSYIEATDGFDLRLTIDYEIQLICENQMQIAMEQYSPKSAKVILLEPSTGKVLAMAQKPSYNLNDLPRDDIDRLMSEGRNGLISDSYEPGSTFKVITASANIEEYYNGNKSAFSPEYIFPSTRYRYIAGRKIKCWSTHDNGKHSNQNLSLALN